ncbi:hypothetical protein PR002_g30973 [Phytophthora rubi]|uniref:Uncharacterized protein n=1 Tax=Phytophthora rubi TaxID=129364 RepID=A0A6A3GL33_9STRA|nr:hypothetical protein PR002_g30973 [Phytophthora rubi]
MWAGRAPPLRRCAIFAGASTACCRPCRQRSSFSATTALSPSQHSYIARWIRHSLLALLTADRPFVMLPNACSCSSIDSMPSWVGTERLWCRRRHGRVWRCRTYASQNGTMYLANQITCRI